MVLRVVAMTETSSLEPFIFQFPPTNFRLAISVPPPPIAEVPLLFNS